MNLGISGKLALVVGASKGLGRAVALELAASGCQVIAVARDGDLLDSLAREMGEVSRQPHYFYRFDLMAPIELIEFLSDLEEAQLSPDIVYHCIGGSVNGLKDYGCSADDYAAVWQFNLGIAIDINNEMMPAMIEKGWGRIVHTSTDGTKCNSGNGPYTSSKFAVEGYVKTVSKQLAQHGVIMTAIAPGNFHTPGKFIYDAAPEVQQDYFAHHLPIRRWAQADEIAKVVAFLCSDCSAFMPGAIVRADGGSR